MGTGKIVRIFCDWTFFLLLFFTAPGACQHLDINSGIDTFAVNGPSLSYGLLILVGKGCPHSSGGLLQEYSSHDGHLLLLGN